MKCLKALLLLVLVLALVSPNDVHAKGNDEISFEEIF